MRYFLCNFDKKKEENDNNKEEKEEVEDVITMVIQKKKTRMKRDGTFARTVRGRQQKQSRHPVLSPQVGTTPTTISTHVDRQTTIKERTTKLLQ